MKNVLVFLAEGFEEIEAVTIVDLLRRANINCKTISITEKREVMGAHGVPFIADMLFDEKMCMEAIGLVLPGGMPGTINLQNHTGLTKVLEEFYKQNKFIGAICAAPMIFGKLGFVKDKKATIYPGMEEHLKEAECSTDMVCYDNHVMTSRAPGTAMAFGLKLIEVFAGEQKAKEVAKGLVYQQ